MPRRYNTDVSWDDPFERVQDQRGAKRSHLHMQITIIVSDEVTRGRLVGPGLVRDISQTGLLVVTKHRLQPGQQVTLSLPTNLCSQTMCLPPAFVGPAEVLRVSSGSKDRTMVALQFGDSLQANMEFALFVESLQRMALVASA